jgi:hypothetical protein
MVQAIINISDHTNRILNIVKAKYGLNDKSQAINVLAEEYEEEMMEPDLRPNYIKKALKIQKQTSIKVGTVDNLRNKYK